MYSRVACLVKVFDLPSQIELFALDSDSSNPNAMFNVEIVRKEVRFFCDECLQHLLLPMLDLGNRHIEDKALRALYFNRITRNIILTCFPP